MKRTAGFVGLGMALGAALGAGIGHIAAGVVLGVVVGTVADVARGRWSLPPCDPTRTPAQNPD